MYCKYCGNQVDDTAAYCQHCGGKLDNVVVNETGHQTTVNVHNYIDTHGRYTSLTSDKSRKKALLLLLPGLGFHLFYVGRIFRGVIRFIIGFFLWSSIFVSIGEPDMLIAGLTLLLLFNIGDLLRLLLGKFRDNTGMCLRA